VEQIEIYQSGEAAAELQVKAVNDQIAISHDVDEDQHALLPHRAAGEGGHDDLSATSSQAHLGRGQMAACAALRPDLSVGRGSGSTPSLPMPR